MGYEGLRRRDGVLNNGTLFLKLRASDSYDGVHAQAHVNTKSESPFICMYSAYLCNVNASNGPDILNHNDNFECSSLEIAIFTFALLFYEIAMQLSSESICIFLFNFYIRFNYLRNF